MRIIGVSTFFRGLLEDPAVGFASAPISPCELWAFGNPDLVTNVIGPPPS